jgi:galactose mutarotase-like enzyme
MKYIYKTQNCPIFFHFTLQTTITKSGFTATINTKGAELVSLKNTQTGREYIWEGNPDFWGKHSPVLFPIVGTLKNGDYHFDGKTYHLPRHGFARDCDFELIEKTENTAVFSLQSDTESLHKYPFRFGLKLSYTLEEKLLTVGYEVINHGNFTMPFSIGAHPAFALPMEFESYSLAFEQPENLLSYELVNDLLSTKTNSIETLNGVLPLTYPLFEKDALIIKQMQSKAITILEDGKPLLKFNFADFPNFGIWTKPNAPFICLEPWLGYSDPVDANGDLMQKEAIQLLDAKSNRKVSFGIEIL